MINHLIELEEKRKEYLQDQYSRYLGMANQYKNMIKIHDDNLKELYQERINKSWEND